MYLPALRFRTAISSLLLILAACGPATDAPAPDAPATGSSPTESERLNAWFDVKYEELLAMTPMSYSYLGRKEQYDQIDQMSPEAEREQLDWFAGTVTELQRDFDYDLLDFETRTSYDMWVYTFEQQRASLEFQNQRYIFEQMGGEHAGLPTFLINYHRVDSLSDMEAYISRIEGIGRAIGQQLDWAQYNAERSVRPPRYAYEMVANESRDLISGRPFDESESDSAVYADALGKIDALLQAETIDEATADRLRTETQTALRSAFQPAYEELISWLQQDQMNVAADPAGVHSLPDGDRYYRLSLEVSTTTTLSPEEVHRIGLDEVARIRGEMEGIKNQVGFAGDLSAFFQFMASNTQFFYANTDAGRQQYLDASTTYIENMKARLPDYFGILPKADLVVKRVEAFREQNGAAAHYFASSPDGAIPGVYYVHLSDMTANPITEMESTAYHEGVPGHHMQIAIASELTNVPQFRTQFGYTAFSEGWALYTELLAKEMGAYEDPYSDFGRLTNEMWRACRLVIDTGLHSMGWSEQQAIDFFASNVSTPIETITSEVRRYLVWPGQAASYKIGMLKILELRQRAMDALGDDFDIRTFHDTVIGGGALPLAILERRVDNYIQTSR